MNLVTMEATRENIAAMLRKEKKFYTCQDYMAADYLAAQSATSPRSVDECVTLVTSLDISDEVSSSPSSGTHDGRLENTRSHSFYRYSPSSVAAEHFVSSACSKTVKPDMDHSHLCPWRRQMCAWAYTAIDTFGLDRELVAVSFNILDRYLAKETKRSDVSVSREDFQLFCMTSIYIAVKIMEPTRKLSIEALIDMSRGYYTAEDITETELDILQSLKWHVHPPTAISFVRSYLELIPNSSSLLPTCQDLTDLAVTDSFFLSYKSSAIAKATVLIAAQQHQFDLIKLGALQDVVDLHTDDVGSIYRHFTK